MSQPLRRQQAANPKRTRRSGAASSTGAAADEDRSVRQRIGSAVSAVTGAFSSSSSASATASSSSAALASRLSLLRLAVVERQLIMQGLGFLSLARLASTCRQMRGEALHKEAGKFISGVPGKPWPDPTTINSAFETESDYSAHASALFRQHVPTAVSLHFVDTAPKLDRVLLQAASFSRVTRLILPSSKEFWTEDRMMRVLSQPWTQRVQEICGSDWLRSERAQHALFALPSLTSVELTEINHALRESAVAQATKLHTAVFSVGCDEAHLVRALRAAPVLSTVELRVMWDDDPEPLDPYVWCVPATVTSLKLSKFSGGLRSAVKTMFTRLPQLRILRTAWKTEMTPLLQGMLDAGVSALPHLRRVVFTAGEEWELNLNRLRRFLRKFPQVVVRIEHLLDAGPGEYGYSKVCRLARWPRVEVEPRPTRKRLGPPPSPHPSDDEPESEVEVEEEPTVPDEQM